MLKIIKRTVRPDLSRSMEGNGVMGKTMLNLAGKEIEVIRDLGVSPYEWVGGGGWSWKEEWLVPLLAPKRGDVIEVSHDGKEWFKRIFLANIEGSYYPTFAIHTNDDIEKPPFHVVAYKYVREIVKPIIRELTLSEIADQLNIPVDQLRIKD